MANVITREDHKYKHYNRALGMHIESKAHYDYVMKRRGFVSQEKGDELARRERERRENPPKAVLSEKARNIIQAAKLRADKKGNVKLGDRTIDAMKELGVAINHPRMPKDLYSKGGFF